MKKYMIALTLIIAPMVLIIASMRFPIYFATEKFAVVDYTKGEIDIVERGFVTAAFTAEGPFPEWAEYLKIRTKPSIILSKTDSKVILEDSDFSESHGMVESGRIIVMPSKGRIIVKVKYADAYYFYRINGEYPIREGTNPAN